MDRRPLVELAALAVVAAAVRLATWPQVFTGAGVRFVTDSDTYYHVLRAQQIVEHFPRFSRFDGGLNYPAGATVLWPPLFDYSIAVPAWLLGGAPGTVERVAAVLPLLLGVGTVLLFRSVARRFVGEAAFTAALLLALSPGSVAYTLLGRPDQHAAEALLAIALAGGFLAAAESGRRRGAALVAGLLAASFWTWQGSGLHLVLLGSVAAAWHTTGEGARGSRALALCAGGAAVLLAVSLGLVAPDALRDLGGAGSRRSTSSSAPRPRPSAACSGSPRCGQGHAGPCGGRPRPSRRRASLQGRRSALALRLASSPTSRRSPPGIAGT
jgi:asparagine N-glycosylation enzyme membrane subunit Stt3